MTKTCKGPLRWQPQRSFSLEDMAKIKRPSKGPQRVSSGQKGLPRQSVVASGLSSISLNMSKGKVRHKGEKELSVIFLQGFVLIPQQWGWYYWKARKMGCIMNVVKFL